jgi:uncharacterized RDD family membrane protein YckC
MLVNLVIGMIYALQANLKPLPLTGNLSAGSLLNAARTPRRSYRAQVAEAAAKSATASGYSVEEATVRVIGFGRRLAAVIIDVILLGFFTFVIVIGLSLLAWLYGSFQPYGDIPFTNLFILLGFIISVAYYVGSWTKSGQTLGKSVLNIKVIGADGASLSWGQAFLRYIGYIVSGLIFSIGFIWVSFDQKRQGWHDKIARTYVIDADDDFLNARPVHFVQSDPGKSWIWVVVWIVIALVTPVGFVSSLWILAPFMNGLITSIFQGL